MTSREGENRRKLSVGEAIEQHYAVPFSYRPEPLPDHLRDKYVNAFYMNMSTTGAKDNFDREALVAAALTVATADVVRMLETRNWRDRMMGAWFALSCHPRDVAAALHEALLISVGLHCETALATAYITLAPGDALEYLEPVFAEAPSRRGPNDVFAAAASTIGPPAPSPSPGALERWYHLHAFALGLRTSFAAARNRDRTPAVASSDGPTHKSRQHLRLLAAMTEGPTL